MSAPYEQLMVLDFETAWCTKTGYTLSKMTTEEYVRDPRFKAWGMSWKWFGEGKPHWISADKLGQALANIDWTKTAVLCHNAQFDAFILSEIYGVHPCFIIDSLSMARALRGVEVGNSLKKLAEAFGLEPKGSALYGTNGLLDELPAHTEAELADYCNHDVYLCESIFNCLLFGLKGLGDAADTYTQQFPGKELRLIDLTLKMFTRPQLVLDSDMLKQAIGEEKVKREALLDKLGISPLELSSNLRFAKVLESLGVTPPKKLSKTSKIPGTMTYAFAKTDAVFQSMLNGDNEQLALLCETRLAVKSTLERTRAQRFLDISARGALPVPLRYFAALNMRWGGDQQINMQNMKRGSFLRRAIMAPKGYVIVVTDLSQIEPRVLAYLADFAEMLAIFASGVDAYAAFGSKMFGIVGMTKDSHPLLRQSAKSGMLGCGYGLGWANFAGQLLAGFLGAPPVLYDKAMARQLGVTREDLLRFADSEHYTARMAEIPHACTDAELLVHCVAAKKIIDIYRRTSQPVVDFWSLCGDAIVRCLSGGAEYEHKCIKFEKGRILMPNGLSLQYPDLKGEEVRYERRGKIETRVEWKYGKGKSLHGGKLTENVVSAVSRCVMSDGMLRIQKRYPVVLTAHDEAGALVPEREAEEGSKWVHEQMIVNPKYLPGIPLNAGTGYAVRYGDAKA